MPARAWSVAIAAGHGPRVGGGRRLVRVRARATIRARVRVRIRVRVTQG